MLVILKGAFLLKYFVDLVDLTGKLLFTTFLDVDLH
jgi:hypothetical protein